MIHPTAIVEDGAEIGENVEIGPYCCVGASVKLGDRVKLLNHVTITAKTKIGADTTVYPFAFLGSPPQHLGYRGEDTALEIGERNLIREHVTMNIGTVAGGGVTRVGAGGFFMVGAHIGHDSQVGERAIFANNATLGGHVSIGEGVFIGGLSAVHQFNRVGDFAFIGGCAAVTTDVIPFALANGNRAMLTGLNVIGLKRLGMPRKTIHAMRSAYRMLFDGDGNFEEHVADVTRAFSDVPEVMQIVSFINEDAPRSLMRPAG